MIMTGEERSSITVKLEPWGTVTGRLVDAAGAPHSGLALGFAYGAYTPPDQGTHPEIFQTDGDGKFRVEGLVPGMKYTLGTLDAASGLITAAAFENLVLKSGETRDLGNLRLGTPGPSGRPRP